MSRVPGVSAGNIQQETFTYFPDTGAADAYVVTMAPAPASYTTGLFVAFKATNANTTTSTINVNGLGTKTIKKNSNSNLVANDIIAGEIVVVIYDGTNFQLISELGNAVATAAGVQNSSYTYALTTGSANAYVLTLSPAPTALAAGQVFFFKSNFANTGAATINVNSLGAIAIKKYASVALVSGDIANGADCIIIYDGTNFQLVSHVSNIPAMQSDVQNASLVYNTSTGSANAYVLTLSPVPAALAAGQAFSFKANFANTGAATLNVNSLGAIAIKKVDGATALASGDIANGQVVDVVYDGTNFQMVSPIGQAAAAGVSIAKTGATNQDMSAATGTTTIAHGLGKTPILVLLDATYVEAASTVASSNGSYDGSTNACTYYYERVAGQTGAFTTSFALYINKWNGSSDDSYTATVTVDGTNITMHWTKTGSPTGFLNFHWTALG